MKDYAWYNENSNGKTHPVGLKKANDFVLFDVHGNVFEWIQDRYHRSYAGAPTDGSAWVSSSDSEAGGRVFRGGSWSYRPLFLRSAFRSRFNFYVRFDNVGFRISRTSFTP